MLNSVAVRIAIYRGWCKKCDICIAFCPRKVLDKDEDGYPVVKEMDLCTGCKLCANRCPDFAITVYSGEKDNEKTENIERSCE